MKVKRARMDGNHSRQLLCQSCVNLFYFVNGLTSPRFTGQRLDPEDESSRMNSTLKPR